MDGKDAELSKHTEYAAKDGALSVDDQGAFEDASKVKETTCISSSPLLANSLSTSET